MIKPLMMRCCLFVVEALILLSCTWVVFEISDSIALMFVAHFFLVFNSIKMGLAANQWVDQKYFQLKEFDQ